MPKFFNVPCFSLLGRSCSCQFAKMILEITIPNSSINIQFQKSNGQVHRLEKILLCDLGLMFYNAVIFLGGTSFWVKDLQEYMAHPASIDLSWQWPITKRREEVGMMVIVTKSVIVEGLRKKKIGRCEFEEKLLMSMNDKRRDCYCHGQRRRKR